MPKQTRYSIGTDKYHTSKKLRDFSVRYFKNEVLSAAVNTPYSGTIVPMEYFGKDDRVQPIMIEVNRKQYLKGGTNIKADSYDEVKTTIQEFLTKVIQAN